MEKLSNIRKNTMSIVLVVVMITTLILSECFCYAANATTTVNKSDLINRIVDMCTRLGISNPNIYSSTEQRGIYFTTDKTRCTVNKDDKTNNLKVAQSSWFKSTFCDGVTKSTMTEGWTCNGFAKFAQWWIWSGNPSASVSVSWLGNQKPSKASASRCQIGDRLDFNNTSHQAIFLGYDDTGFIVIDSNYVVYPSNIVAIHRIPYSKYSQYDCGRAKDYTLIDDDPVENHIVNNDYDTNFFAYPKAQITAENIFDEYHNQISSTAWIGTSDLCTIHEVYTDGCCRLTYPLDNGGSKTVYSKISLFNPYISNYTGSSNEETIFNFLTLNAGFNVAGACGIIANIYCESGFNPNALGDGGTSYGICQWHDSRWDRLKTYCNNNGLNWQTLDGQLNYLVYELKNYYSGVYNYITSVDNSADGAYNAGYYWCYNFEIPANTSSVSVTRGNLASNTYWPKYNNTHVIDTNYGTNFTAYPKAYISSENIFDTDHNQISSTSWIGTNDLCTIHEVYTDGCCKVTYPLDSGGSKTVYSKISLFSLEYKLNYDLYAWGFNNQDGISGGKDKSLLGSSYVTKTNGEQFVIDASYNSIAIPRGYTLCNIYSTESYGSAWGNVTLGTETVTQPANDTYVQFHCEPIRYNINYALNGGTNASSNPSTYNVLYGVTFAAPTKAGYTFAGWTDASGSAVTGINPGANAWHESAAALYSMLSTRTIGDQTVYANWTPDTYTVLYNANGGTGAPETQIKYHGVDLTLSSVIPEKKCVIQFDANGGTVDTASKTVYFVFKSWIRSEDYLYYNAGSDYKIDEPATMVASWDYQKLGKLPIPVRDGYNFDGWYTALTDGLQKTEDDYLGANATLYAHWTKITEIETDANIVVDSANVVAGKDVTVKIRLENNPGIGSMKLNVSYDKSVMTVKSATVNKADLGGMTTVSPLENVPLILNWFNGDEDVSGDVLFATIVFTVSADAEEGSYPVTVTYSQADVYNYKYDEIPFNVVNGTVTVKKYVPGDVNNDGLVNNKDLTSMFRFLSGWTDPVNEAAIDVNGDGARNNKDLTHLFRYLSGWELELH